MSDIPLAHQAPPAIEPVEDPGAPLGSDTIQLVSGMAATILAGSIAMARADLEPEDAAVLAVRMSIAVANEVRQYRIVDGKAVRMGSSDA